MLCETCGKLFDLQAPETMCFRCEWLMSTPFQRLTVFTKETNERMYQETLSK